MLRRFCLLAALLILGAGTYFAFAQPATRDPVAVSQGGITWIANQIPLWKSTAPLDCFSCHVPGAALLGTSVAASRGYRVDPDALQTFAQSFGRLQAPTENRYPTHKGGLSPQSLLVPIDFNDSAATVPVETGRAALGLVPYLVLLNDPSAAALPPRADDTILSVSQGVVDWALAHQSASGYWPSNAEDSPNQADLSNTASLVLLLDFWAKRDPSHALAILPVLQKAKSWLEKAGDARTDARARSLLLMALTALGDEQAAAQTASQLVAEQQTDMQKNDYGGWWDTKAIPASKRRSGGWATGMAVYALQQFDPVKYATVIQRGRDFLLASAQDGPQGTFWPSATGAMPVKTGFNGIPVDENGQPIDVIALEPTAWAVAALSLAAKPKCEPSIEPQDARLFAGPGHTLQFTAQRVACIGDAEWTIAPADAGSIDPDTGLYTAPDDLKAPLDVKVQLTLKGEGAVTTATLHLLPRVTVQLSITSPSNAVDLGRSLTFIPSVNVSPGFDSGVIWTLEPKLGEVKNGIYQAPDHAVTPATVHVIATSKADPSVSAIAEVTLRPPVVNWILPQRDADGFAPFVWAGDSEQFLANIRRSADLPGPTDDQIQWQVVGEGAAITPDGLLTAKPDLLRTETITVRAVSDADPTQFVEARVRVYPRIEVTVSPTATPEGPLRLIRSSTRVFTATLLNVPPEIKKPGITWALKSPDGIKEIPPDAEHPRTLELIAPWVGENTAMTLIARSSDDPRVQVEVPLLIVAAPGFIRIKDTTAKPGDVVPITLQADQLEGQVVGGKMTLSFNSPYLDFDEANAAMDSRTSAKGVRAKEAVAGSRTTLTVMFDSSDFTGPGDLLTVPVRVADDASAGDIYFSVSAEFQGESGGVIVPTAGDGALTLLPIKVHISVPDLTAMPGERIDAPLTSDRKIHASAGVIGMTLGGPKNAPPLQVPDPTNPDNFQFFTASGSPTDTTFIPLFTFDPQNPPAEYAYFFRLSEEMRTPGVAFTMPVQVPADAARGTRYTLTPILDFPKKVYDQDDLPGTLTVIDPALAFDHPPATVQAGQSAAFSVQAQDVPDDQIAWKVLTSLGASTDWANLPPGPGSMEVNGSHAVYHAPDSVPPGGSVIVVAYSTRYPDKVYDTAAVKVLPRPSLTVSPPNSTLFTGHTLDFTASLIGIADNSQIIWTASPSLGTFAVDSAHSTRARFTAVSTLPNDSATVTVTAALKGDPTVFGTATVTLQDIEIIAGDTPALVSVGGTASLSARVTGAADTGLVWSVAGGDVFGTVDAAGNYTAPAQVPPGGVASVTAQSHADPNKSVTFTLRIGEVSVVPIMSSMEMALGGAVDLSAKVVGVDNQAVRWELIDGPGSVTPNGHYAAPPSGTTPTDIHVRVTSIAAPRRATVTIHLLPVSIQVSPPTAELHPGESLDFKATVANAADSGVKWEVVGGVASGSITPQGHYTAPPKIGANPVTLRATSNADPTKSATATVTLVVPPPTETTQVSLTPKSVDLNLGESQEFTAVVTGTDNKNVTWTLDGPGVLDDAGHYHAPVSGKTPFTARITAAWGGDSTLQASAEVHIRQVVVTSSQSSVQVQPGATTTLIAQVFNATDTGILWSLTDGASLGSLSPDGTFTASPNAAPGAAATAVAASIADPTAQTSIRIVIGTPPSAVAQTPWPMARHDIYRTGRSDAVGPLTPNLLWTQPDAESDLSSPALDAASRLYVGTRDRSMVSLEPTGALRWSLSQTIQDKGWMRSTPAVNSDGTLYLVSPSNFLFAIRPDGTALWQVNLNPADGSPVPGTPSSPLLAPDGTLFVAVGNAVIAVEASGTVRWRTALPIGAAEITSSPAMGRNGRILIGSGAGAVYSLDPQTGDSALLYQTFGGITATPAINSVTGEAVFGSEDGGIYTVREDGTLTGKVDAAGGVTASAALGTDGTAYVPASDGYLYAVRSSQLLWKTALSASIEQPVAVDAFGRIYAAVSDANLACLTSAGRVLWTLPLPAPATSAPILGGEGRLYLSVKGQGLMAFGNDGATLLLGDVNGDGTFNLADVTLALQFATGAQIPTAAQVQAGDVAPRTGSGDHPTGDGKITVADVSQLLRRALGLDQVLERKSSVGVRSVGVLELKPLR